MTLTRSAPAQRTPMKRRSDRKRKAQAERVALVQEMVDSGRGCEIGPWLWLAVYSSSERVEHLLFTHAARDCRGVIEGIHERRKRTAGGSLVNPQNLIPACNVCNGWVEDRPTLARRIGLVVRAGDPEWTELAA